MNNNQLDEEHRAQVSQLHPSAYTQIAPPQGDAKPRRLQKKNKGENCGAAATKKPKLSTMQVNILEMNFGNEQKLEPERKDRLASELGLHPRQVVVWFQNRRVLWKNKKLEEDYGSLKKIYENVLSYHWEDHYGC